MKKLPIQRSAQAGFTLIELIVVIVILGILAATALPRFSDLSGDARIAKMQAAAGAVRSASAMVHGSWLVLSSNSSVPASSLASTSLTSVLLADGQPIAFINAYPDVGGDGSTNAAATPADSGIVVAAGGLKDYTLTANTTTLTVRPDGETTTRPNCYFTYVEATATTAPVIDTSRLTTTYCK